MRICLLLYGNFDNYTITLPNIVDKLKLNHYNVDIFIYSSSDCDIDMIKTILPNVRDHIIESNDNDINLSVEQHAEALRTYLMKLNESEIISGSYRKFRTEVLSTTGTNFYFCNWLRNYYRLYMCNKLKRKYETTHNFVYDVVAKLNAECVIIGGFDVDMLYEKAHIYDLVRSPGEYWMNEFFFLGSNAYMDIYIDRIYDTIGYHHYEMGMCNAHEWQIDYISKQLTNHIYATALDNIFHADIVSTRYYYFYANELAKLLGPNPPNVQILHMRKFKLVIYGTYKAGTTSLDHRLKCLPSNYTVFKEHPQCLNDIHSDVDIIVIPQRDHIDTFISGYFEDISNPAYDYYLGSQSEIRKYSIEEIIEAFLSFDWSSFSYLNQKSINDDIYNMTGVTIDKSINPNNDSYVIIDTVNKLNNRNIRLVIVDIRILNKPDIMKQLYLRMGILLREITLHSLICNLNQGDTKWYSDIYAKFKRKLDRSQLSCYDYMRDYNIFA